MRLRSLLVTLNFQLCVGFLVPREGAKAGSLGAGTSRSSILCLVPIRQFHKDFSFLSEPADRRCCIDSDGVYRDADRGEIYTLCLAQEQDLPDLSRFVIQSFGSDAVRLSTDINAFERAIMKPAVELLNNYSGIVAFAEVLAGLRSRLEGRFQHLGLGLPNLNGLDREEKIRRTAGEAIVLVLGNSQEGSDWHIDIIASIELRLQPCDAKIPFSLPWLDGIERRLASLIGLGKNQSRDLQPYLSNLCVDEVFRGKQIGRALVRCVESIANESWGYTRMYLHVDSDNPAAMQLYKSEGYKDVGLRWRPFWAGKASEIGYFVKKLEPSR